MDDSTWIKMIDRLRSKDEVKRTHAALMLSRAVEYTERTREVLTPLLEDEEPIRSMAEWVLARMPDQAQSKAA
jgi:hypothetical protein